MSQIVNYSLSQPAEDLEEFAWAVITPSREKTRSSLESFCSSTGKINQIAWGSNNATGKVVLLVHGWEGSASDMALIGKELEQQGLRCVYIDLLAHGNSDGTSASIPDAALSLLPIIKHFQPSAVIAHSVGCAVVAESIALTQHKSELIFISAPESFDQFVTETGNLFGFSSEDLRYVSDFFKTIGIDTDKLHLATTVSSIMNPMTFIHSEDDRICSIEPIKRIVANHESAELHSLNGLGHTRILRDPAVIEICLGTVLRVGK